MISYGGWTPKLQASLVHAEGGYGPGATAGVYGTAVYGADLLAGTWRDLNCELLRVTADSGGRLERIPGVRAGAGQLSADVYDPIRLLDPAATPMDRLRVGTPIRLVMVAPDTVETLVVWTGWAELWDHDLKSGEGTLTASDTVARLGALDVADWVRPQENASSRYAAVLALATGLPGSSVAGSATTVAAGKFSGSAWQIMVRTAEAEQAILTVDPAGRIIRRPTLGTPTAITATDCDDSAADLIYTSLHSVVDDDILANLVTVERVDVPENLANRPPLQQASTDSVAQYGARVLSQNDLTLPTDTALYAWAANVVALRAWPEPRLTGMEIVVANVMPWAARTARHLAELTVGDSIIVTLTSRGTPGQWGVAVAGLAHTMTPDEWSVRVDLADSLQIALNRGYNDPLTVYNGARYSGPGLIPEEAEVA